MVNQVREFRPHSFSHCNIHTGDQYFIVLLGKPFRDLYVAAWVKDWKHAGEGAAVNIAMQDYRVEGDFDCSSDFTLYWSPIINWFHLSGVEWGWWPGPTACTGTGTGLSFNDLSAGALKPVIACDAVQFRFLGMSLAGYNALISAAIVLALLVSAAISRGPTASSR